jgi:hypothetical protein
MANMIPKFQKNDFLFGILRDNTFSPTEHDDIISWPILSLSLTNELDYFPLILFVGEGLSIPDS